jgi:hypothetical protein
MRRQDHILTRTDQVSIRTEDLCVGVQTLTEGFTLVWVAEHDDGVDAGGDAARKLGSGVVDQLGTLAGKTNVSYCYFKH